MPRRRVKPRRSEIAARTPLGALVGCPFHELRMKFAAAGLRPTRPRLSLGWILFSHGDRHLTAEALQDEAQASKVPVSLATIYNNLHQFTDAGLLREVAVDGTRTYFDTNTARHHHFLIDGALIDIPEIVIDQLKLPPPPQGKAVAAVDIVVRLRDAAV